MPELPTLPDPQAFYAQVWNIVVRIPRGKVASYGQIAKMIRPPAGVDAETYAEFGALWVSNAISASPNDVPWQRVVNSQGRISEREGAERQRQLLEGEGIVFDAKDRIDLKKFGWNGKTGEDEPRQPSLF